MALKQKAQNLKIAIQNEKDDIKYYSGIVEKSRKNLAKFEAQLKGLNHLLAQDYAKVCNLQIPTKKASAVKRYDIFKRIVRAKEYGPVYKDRRQNGLSVKIDCRIETGDRAIFRKLADEVVKYKSSSWDYYKDERSNEMIERYVFNVPRTK